MGDEFRREVAMFRRAYEDLAGMFTARDPRAPAMALDLVAIYRQAAETLQKLAALREERDDPAGAAILTEQALRSCQRGLTVAHLVRAHSPLDAAGAAELEQMDAEYRRRRRPDPLQALRFRNLIDEGHLAAAERIRDLAEALSRQALASAAELDAAPRSMAERFTFLVARSEELNPWFRALDLDERQLAHAVLIDWRSLDSARADVHLGWESAARKLAEALKKFPLTGSKRRA